MEIILVKTPDFFYLGLKTKVSLPSESFGLVSVYFFVTDHLYYEVRLSQSVSGYLTFSEEKRENSLEIWRSSLREASQIQSSLVTFQHHQSNNHLVENVTQL